MPIRYQPKIARSWRLQVADHPPDRHDRGDERDDETEQRDADPERVDHQSCPSSTIS